eukprot:jgi/Mesen1/6467/ME000033S05747
MGNTNSSPHRSRPNTGPHLPPPAAPPNAPLPAGYPNAYTPHLPPYPYGAGPQDYPLPPATAGGQHMPGPAYQAAPPGQYPPHYGPGFHPVETNRQWVMNIPQPPLNYRAQIHAAPIHPPIPPPAVVEPQRTTTIRNKVNLRRATLHLEKDVDNPGQYLVAFSFDATVAGSICIFFMAREGDACSFTSLRREVFSPIRVPFEAGLAQKFCQAPGTGVDLSRLEEAELASVGPGEVYPLVVRTQTAPAPPPDAPAPLEADELPGGKLPSWVQSQSTYATVQRHADGEPYLVPVKQKIWVDGTRYELQEIYGIEQGSAAEGEGGGEALEAGKECVICLSEPRDTTVLPCRHMCMCSDCAKVLRYQTNRCPICRQVIERLLEIKGAKDEPKADQPSFLFSGKAPLEGSSTAGGSASQPSGSTDPAGKDAKGGATAGASAS